MGQKRELEQRAGRVSTTPETCRLRNGGGTMSVLHPTLLVNSSVNVRSKRANFSHSHYPFDHREGGAESRRNQSAANP